MTKWTSGGLSRHQSIKKCWSKMFAQCFIDEKSVDVLKYMFVCTKSLLENNSRVGCGRLIAFQTHRDGEGMIT